MNFDDITLNYLNDLFYLKSYENLLDIISKYNEELYYKFQKELVKLHIDTLVALNRLGDCYRSISIYKSYKYISMDMEEFLDNINNNIESYYYRKNNKYISELENIANNLYELYEKDKITSEEKIEVENILDKNFSDEINFLCLSIFYKNSIFLVHFKYKNETYFDDISKIHFPFTLDDIEYLKIYNLISKNDKNVSIFEMQKRVLNDLRLEIFPNHFDNKDINNIYNSIVYYVNKCFGITNDKILINDFSILDKIRKIYNDNFDDYN